MKNDSLKRVRRITKHPLFWGAMVSCIILYLVGLSWLINYLISDFDSWIYERSTVSDFEINTFPSRYRFEMNQSTTIPKQLDYKLWMTIWYTNSYTFEEYEFVNKPLRQKAQWLIELMQTPHPIWTEPEVSSEQLSRLPSVKDFSSFVDFSDVVDQITIRDTKLGQNPAWQQKVQSWKLLQVQSKVLFIYLVYLDQQSELPNQLIIELDSLAAQIGPVDWYEQFQSHLDSYWFI